MISTDEIRRVAGTLGLDPSIVDHDYVLGCFLHYLFVQKEVKASWVFKGGTALAKCHFPEYRFSEDLDFTATTVVNEQSVRTLLDRAKTQMMEGIGLRTDRVDTSVEIVNDDYGKESIEAKIYVQGIWVYRGSPRSVQVHINRDETILFSPVEKLILHPYSDREGLPSVRARTYTLEEVFAEKLRAFSGQRKFAVARDLFDLYHLYKAKIDTAAALRAFPAKCALKGIDPSKLDIDSVVERKEEFRTNWEKNLEYLVPESMKVPFEEAWSNGVILLKSSLRGT